MTPANGKTSALIGLFLAASLVSTTTGCSSYEEVDCDDYNEDGYCDDDSSGGSHVYSSSSKKSKSSAISKGSKGGLGSSGVSSSG
ncbi:MAG: hypothetical protein ACM32O_02060 [Clostridia bacterium]